MQDNILVRQCEATFRLQDDRHLDDGKINVRQTFLDEAPPIML